MDRYAIEARARADELLDMLPEQADVIRGWWDINADKDLRSSIVTLSPRTQTILAQTPAKDRAWREKTPAPKFLREWLAARYWAIASARALSIAAELQTTPGRGYRQAVRSAAPTADRWLDRPDLEEMLTLRLLDE